MLIYLANLTAIVEQRLDSLKSVLSPGENWRYQGFLRTERATQFLVGRYLLRQLLASHLGVAPQEVPLIERHNNAPLLDFPNTEQLGFSISHSKSWVACGFRSDAKIGVDIEWIDTQRDVVALAEHSLTAEQNASLIALAPHQQHQFFYQHWTAQEAQIKLGVAQLDTCQITHSQLAIAVCSNKIFHQAPKLIHIAI